MLSLFFSIFLIFFANLIDYSVPSKISTFEIETQKDDREEIGYLQRFNIIYNFEKELGEIQFRINNDDNIKHIIIDFPTKIENKSLKIFTFDCIYDECTKEKNINFTYKTILNPINKEEYTTLIIDFKDNNINNTKFKILFSATNFYPSGSFIFRNSGATKVYFDNVAVTFDFGNTYSCVEECYKNYENTKEHYLSESSKKRIDFNKIGNENNFVFSFKTINQKEKQRADIIRDIAIALGAGVFMLFIEVGAYYFVEIEQQKTKYKCKKCLRGKTKIHYYNSKIGKKHLKYKK